jgi:hypothetical protein
VRKRYVSRPPARHIHRSELESRLREALRHWNAGNFSDAKSGLLDVADSGFGPDMINGHQKNDVIGNLHGVSQETANLAPWRIGDYPFDTLSVGEEIAAFAYFAPLRVRPKQPEKVSGAAARLKDSTARSEVGHKLRGKFWRGLHYIVADVITVWLGFHLGWLLFRNVFCSCEGSGFRMVQ